MNTDLKKLQNGSDLRGVAIATEKEQVNLNPEIASLFGRAFTLWLADKMHCTPEKLVISVGNDSRITAEPLKAGIISGIKSTGASAKNFGLASTPAMFMSTIMMEFSCSGSVMITASHLPYNRNGFKFFTADGGLEKNDISALISIAEKLAPEKITSASAAEPGLMDVYSAFLAEKISKGIAGAVTEKPLSGLKIIVDAGNGAGGFFVEKVLKPLGADTSGSQFLEPDGMFPNHEPNPENDDAMKSIQSAVLASKADLGIIFDTDVDRAAIVDSDGTIINRNSLIALIASIILKEHPGTTIVTDSVTSDGLADFINNTLGGRHHRFRRGYKNVINEAIRLNSEGKDCHLAIETSGHGAIKENFFLDDGAYLVVKIIAEMAKLRIEKNAVISSLIKDLRHPAEEKEFRISLLDANFTTQGKNIIGSLEKFVLSRKGWSIVPENYEGVRVSCSSGNGDGWFLMRLSLHDPVIPLNIESEVRGGVKQIAEEILDFLKPLINIKFDSLQKYLS
ncbi:MAG TPA: phosphomannomutase/phosphoglucomutase [Spirochaetota bacterium]|nr:phosphomannomutase/phosphoglucomutase [Spirochaetota bacterium]